MQMFPKRGKRSPECAVTCHCSRARCACEVQGDPDVPAGWDLTPCERSGDSRSFTPSYMKPPHPKHQNSRGFLCK